MKLLWANTFHPLKERGKSLNMQKTALKRLTTCLSKQEKLLNLDSVNHKLRMRCWLNTVWLNVLGLAMRCGRIEIYTCLKCLIRGKSLEFVINFAKIKDKDFILQIALLVKIKH